jgi:AcrR family transcriptional regulator
MRRRYTLKRRAEARDETRDRIVRAAIELHAQGPASITAIAARARVGRMTVYRHFPQEDSLILACTSTVFEERPLPDPDQWTAIADPTARLGVALNVLYSYYADMAALLASAEANTAGHPGLAKAFAPFDAALDRIRQALRQGWTVDASPGSLLAGVIGHATAFATWRSLIQDQGLTPRQASEAMIRLVDSTAATTTQSTGERPTARK